MRKKISVAVATSIAVLALLVVAASSLNVVAGDPDTVTSVFKVEGMTCGGCEAGVRISVKKLDGVEKVEASHEEGLAKVTYDPEKVTVEKIKAAIEKLGYSAELEKTEEKGT